MQQLCNKRILLGITGGIAAYKAAELVRILKKAGAEVRVVMTAGAMEFITPLTLQALSGNPVHHALLDPEAGSDAEQCGRVRFLNLGFHVSQFWLWIPLRLRCWHPNRTEQYTRTNRLYVQTKFCKKLNY